MTTASDDDSVTVGELLSSFARSLADAQRKLDIASTRRARDLLSTRVAIGVRTNPDGTTTPWESSMLELGFVPTFYQFVETVFEVAITARVTRGAKGSPALAIAPLDASTSQTFRLDASVGSRLRVSIVPVPPPPEDALRRATGLTAKADPLPALRRPR